MYHNMTSWILGVNLNWSFLTVRCIRLQLPVSSSCIYYNGYRMSVAIWTPVWNWFIVIILKLGPYPFKIQHRIHVNGDWWFDISDLDCVKLLSLRQLTTQFYDKCMAMFFVILNDVCRLLSLRGDACCHNEIKSLTSLYLLEILSFIHEIQSSLIMLQSGLVTELRRCDVPVSDNKSLDNKSLLWCCHNPFPTWMNLSSHWGRVMHAYMRRKTRLSLIQIMAWRLWRLWRPAFVRTSGCLLAIRSLGTNFGEVWIKIHSTSK